MLEDESGRLRLTGDLLHSSMLVTGCIVAALGSENADGVFEVIDTKIADLPRQPDRWERDEEVVALAGGKVKQARPASGKVAIVSGLCVSGDSGNTFLLDMLMEYLLGEAGDGPQRTQISRLIIAGDSLSNAAPIPSREELASKKTSKKYGYDSSSYLSLIHI